MGVSLVKSFRERLFGGDQEQRETVSEVIKYGRYGRIFSRGNYIEKVYSIAL